VCRPNRAAVRDIAMSVFRMAKKYKKSLLGAVRDSENWM
jgi:hypothetical protein